MHAKTTSAAFLKEARPGPEFLPNLSRGLLGIIEEEKWRFGCTDREFLPEEVVGAAKLLPLVLHQAGRWMRESLGDEAPMGFREASEPLPGEELPPPCSAVPVADMPTATLSVWLLYARHALSSLVQEHLVLRPEATREPVLLDGWYEQWIDALEQGHIQLRPPVEENVPEGVSARPSSSPLDTGLPGVRPGVRNQSGS